MSADLKKAAACELNSEPQRRKVYDGMEKTTTSKISRLADGGRKRILWAGQDMPVLQTGARAISKRKAVTGHAFLGMSSCHGGNRQPGAGAQSRRSGCAAVRLQSAFHAGRRGGFARATRQRFRPTPSRARTTRPITAISSAALDHKPVITMDDGADLVSLLHTDYAHLASNLIASMEETTTGVIRLRALGKRRSAEDSRHRRQRCGDQTFIRQPLRHRPIDHRRCHSRHRYVDRRQERCRRRLRLVRQGRGVARARHGRARSSSRKSIRCALWKRPWTASK